MEEAISAPAEQAFDAQELPFAFLASFCRETHAFEPMRVSFPIKLGQTDGGCRRLPGSLTRFLARFHEASIGRDGGCNDLRRSLTATNEAPEGYCQAAFRLGNDRSVNKAAIFMRLLASTAAATHSSKRLRP